MVSAEHAPFDMFLEYGDCPGSVYYQAGIPAGKIRPIERRVEPGLRVWRADEQTVVLTGPLVPSMCNLADFLRELCQAGELDRFAIEAAAAVAIMHLRYRGCDGNLLVEGGDPRGE
jgi:hypothetical protein